MANKTVGPGPKPLRPYRLAPLSTAIGKRVDLQSGSSDPARFCRRKANRLGRELRPVHTVPSSRFKCYNRTAPSGHRGGDSLVEASVRSTRSSKPRSHWVVQPVLHFLIGPKYREPDCQT